MPRRKHQPDPEAELLRDLMRSARRKDKAIHRLFFGLSAIKDTAKDKRITPSGRIAATVFLVNKTQANALAALRIEQ